MFVFSNVSVEFWVLAIDHDLKVASDITASVYLIDPSNTKVAMWEQVSLGLGENRNSKVLFHFV